MASRPRAPPPRPARRRARAGAAAAAAALLTTLPAARAQYNTGTEFFRFTMEAATNDLVDELQNLPLLEDVFVPDKYLQPSNFYIWNPPGATGSYINNVIFDPCRGQEHNCCRDTFATPEFRRRVTDYAADDYGAYRYYYGDGSQFLYTFSRQADSEYYVDETCEDQFVPRLDCVLPRMASRPFRFLPKCWNFNESIVADRPCRNPGDGSLLDLCMEIGFSQSAYVMDCNVDFRSSPSCGTFLEVHRPGRPEVLSAVRLRGQYASGYRNYIVSMTYKRAPDRVICYDPLKDGAYELWWVQRTASGNVVELRAPFKVVSPLCDWNEVYNRYEEYATVSVSAPDLADPATVSRRSTKPQPSPSISPFRKVAPVQLASLDPYDKARFMFARQRVESRSGIRPGKGMGATLVKAVNASYPPGAVLDPTDESTYYYSPARPLYTVRMGVIEPPNYPPNEVGLHPPGGARRRLAADAPAPAAPAPDAMAGGGKWVLRPRRAVAASSSSGNAAAASSLPDAHNTARAATGFASGSLPEDEGAERGSSDFTAWMDALDARGGGAGEGQAAQAGAAASEEQRLMEWVWEPAASAPGGRAALSKEAADLEATVKAGGRPAGLRGGSTESAQRDATVGAREAAARQLRARAAAASSSASRRVAGVDASQPPEDDE